MPPGVTRILPFAVISAALHAAVLMNAPERLEIAVTPGGDTGPVAVRLVPAGATTPDPATQSGVAASIPEPSRERDEQPDPSATTAEADRADENPADASSGSAEQETTELDRVQAASPDRIRTDVAPTDTDQARTDTSGSAKKEPSEESARSAAATQTVTSDTPDTPQAPEASETAEQAETPEPTQDEDASATESAARTVETTDHTAERDRSDAPEDETKAEKQSGAEGADDRAQLASRARQQVEIHFRDRFRYPRIARQRGWEGRVVLTFRLQPDGRITDVEVSESSGRSILDENARQTLIHIQRIPELADRLGPEPLELEVPVTYRLQPA